LDGIVLVMDRRRRAGQIEDSIDLDVEREGHVVSYQFEIWIFEVLANVRLRAGKEIVDAEDVVL